jgi:two-component system, OmpR family, sensor kinase
MAHRPSVTSARARILGWYVALLALALVLAVVLVRQVLIDRINARIDAELVESAGELSSLARSGVAPGTEEPFASVAQLLSVGVRSGVAEQNATLIGVLDGRSYVRSPQPVPIRLDLIPSLVARWSAATRTVYGSVQTAAGQVRYVAVPVTLPDQASRGVLVSAVFASRDLAEASDITRLLGETMVVALLAASCLAWFAAGRILAPVRTVTNLARSITESDLTARLPVRGNDEMSELARTFNLMLDRLDQAFATQRAFIDDAGHELRTPITIIRGHLELLGDDPADRAEAMAIVTDELNRMSRQVDDLLTLAKAAQPAFLHLGTCDVAGLTHEIYAKAQTLGDRQWALADVGRGRAVLDRQRITQALVQLATNGVQHTQPADRITLGSVTQDGYVRFWVKDSGPGIALADQAHIFDRFTRAANGRPAGSGAGLGLAIVRSIAVAHHGHVEVTSTLGQGATFTLTVPVDPPIRDRLPEPGR